MSIFYLYFSVCSSEEPCLSKRRTLTTALSLFALSQNTDMVLQYFFFLFFFLLHLEFWSLDFSLVSVKVQVPNFFLSLISCITPKTNSMVEGCEYLQKLENNNNNNKFLKREHSLLLQILYYSKKKERECPLLFPFFTCFPPVLHWAWGKNASSIRRWPGWSTTLTKSSDPLS